MKIKSFFLLLALAGLGTSCTNDEGLDENPSVSGGSSEIQLMFGGSGDGVDYTKAIATDAENEMKDLDVYVFASNAKNGTYYYVETWKKKDTAPAAGEKGFMLQASGSGKMASIKPTEIVGLPYLKLFCVANSKPYAQEGTSAKQLTLTAVTAYDQEASTPTPATPTTADVFVAAFTKKLGGDAGTDLKVLTCPLPMSGVGETKISGSVSKVDIELTRAVARFDIDNDQATSRLTIQQVSVLNGRKNAPLFKDGALATVGTDAEKAAELMNYDNVDFTALPNANRGETTSALYVAPGAATDGTMLLITGQYLNPTGDPVPASYKIEVKLEGNAIAIGRNNRYKLRIGNVTESQISAAFEIEDWVSNGGVIIKPDNAQPSFPNNNIMDAIEIVTPDAGDKPAQDAENPFALRLKDNAGSFKLTTYASAAVEAEIEELTGGTPWLTLTATETKDDAEMPGRKITTFTFSYTGATGAVPLSLTLRNSAASYDPELWTVLTINGPFQAPAVAPLADQTGFTAGNTVSVDDATGAVSATMYNAGESFVQLNMTSVDEVKIDAPAWLSVTAGKGTKAVEPVTYTIKIAGEVPEGTTEGVVKFINAADNTDKPATTEVTITLADPAMTVEKGTDTNAAATFTPADNPTAVNVDLDLLSTGNFTFKVKAPQGVTAPDFSACTWLTITESAWTKDNGYAEYTVAAKSDATAFDAFTAEFTNAIKNGGNVSVTFTKAAELPVFAANTQPGYTNSAFNDVAPDFSSPQAATATLYKANQSKIYLALTCAEGVTLDVPAGLSMTEADATNHIYEVAVSDASQLAGNSAVITAKNSSDENRTATITLTLVAPAITVTGLTGTAATIADDVITIDNSIFTSPATATVSFTVNGRKGSAIAISDLSNSWVAAPGAPTVIGENGTATITIMSISAANADSTDPVTVTVTNAVTNGGDKTITINKN